MRIRTSPARQGPWSSVSGFWLILTLSLLTLNSTAQTSLSPKRINFTTSEGTTLSFDVSPDARSIVFDLLGQLWIVARAGGAARPITDAVRDSAEDSDPSFSPDGRRVLFRGERNGRTGLWLISLDSKEIRQLTQLINPEGYEGNAAWSPDGQTIAFTRTVFPSSPGGRPRSAIILLDVTSGNERELTINGLPNPNVSDPVWLPDEKQIVFVTRRGQSERGGRIWIVPAAGGQATAVTGESVQALAPAVSKDGRRIVYFAADKDGRTQIWLQEIANGPSRRLTDHKDVTVTRVRWIPGNDELMYSADGRLWTIAASGGQPAQVSFTANVSFARQSYVPSPVTFPEPGQSQMARGFMGLALSPDKSRIGILALGKLWVIPIGGDAPRQVAEVPFEASALAWAPDGNEVAWSAGIAGQEDLFATNLNTGTTRRITSLSGRESYPAYSPDGRHLAFVHMQNDDGVLRVIDADATNVADMAMAKMQSLGSIGTKWANPPQWSPDSDGLLVTGDPEPDQPTPAYFVPLSGERKAITRFPDAPIFLQWTSQQKILFVRHDRLWQASFDRNGMSSEPQALGDAAALYASASRDGTLLFVSAGGLRLRSPTGNEQTIGWPVTYRLGVPAPMVIRNVRIIDGTGAPVTQPRDIFIEQGRIKKITAAGALGAWAVQGLQTIDAGGRVVIPGLMDLHAHTYRPDLLPGFLYFGITTIRDQGSPMAPLVAYRDAIAAGALPGPRVTYGGFQFYSDWSIDEEQGRGIEPEADPDHIRRSVDLAQAFGAQHIKTRTFRRWDLNARMIAEAHRRGMRATGHCSHLLPLVAVGMDAKEHIGSCENRGDTYMYDDLIQLYKVAGISVVPTVSYFELAVRLHEKPGMLDGDAELAPFMPAKENFGWMLDLKVAGGPSQWASWARRAHEEAAKLWRAGVTIGTGTDIWEIPTGVHMELEQLVAAGVPPLEAIRAGTGNAARILGAEKDLGTIEEGKWADLVLLDADPTVDIHNTRRIWQVIKGGQIVDRPGIIKVMQPR
jgi:Tol biopolymer transport system component